jgi:hypothetical protein
LARLGRVGENGRAVEVTPASLGVEKKEKKEKKEYGGNKIKDAQGGQQALSAYGQWEAHAEEIR